MTTTAQTHPYFKVFIIVLLVALYASRMIVIASLIGVGIGFALASLGSFTKMVEVEKRLKRSSFNCRYFFLDSGSASKEFLSRRC